MKIDVKRVWDQINTELKSELPVAPKMLRIIGACEESHPHSDWERLRLIDYEGSVGQLETWFSNAIAANPPEIFIRGVWVGLTNPMRGGKVSADMYFAGSKAFDRDNPDWAVKAEYRPENAYAKSSALAGIYDIAYHGKDSLGNDAEWSLCLAYAALVVRQLLAKASPSLFRASGSVGVTVGFDSGDYIDVGELSSSGLAPFPAKLD